MRQRTGLDPAGLAPDLVEQGRRIGFGGRCKLAVEDVGADPIVAQGDRALAQAHVAAHQEAVRMLIARIDAQQLLDERCTGGVVVVVKLDGGQAQQERQVVGAQVFARYHRVQVVVAAVEVAPIQRDRLLIGGCCREGSRRALLIPQVQEGRKLGDVGGDPAARIELVAPIAVHDQGRAAERIAELLLQPVQQTPQRLAGQGHLAIGPQELQEQVAGEALADVEAEVGEQLFAFAPRVYHDGHARFKELKGAQETNLDGRGGACSGHGGRSAVCGCRHRMVVPLVGSASPTSRWCTCSPSLHGV